MIFNSTNNKSKWLAFGLIALTILVIVGIVLVVYFVNKNSQPINYTQIEINKEDNSENVKQYQKRKIKKK